MRILCVFGQHNYGDPARGEGVEYSHFLPALRALGHEVEFFESFSRAPHADFAALNRALLLKAQQWRPDVVFTVLMLSEVWLETIALLRGLGCRVVNWSTDDSWKYAQFSRLIAADFDLWVTTCPDARAWYARDGIGNVQESQWAASSAWLAQPKPARECSVQVSFIGSAYGNRPMRIEALCAAGIAVQCHGYGWPAGPLSAGRIADVVRDSQVSLNFSEAGQGGGKQIKARLFEVPACGGMLLTESAPHVERYFAPGTELVQFEDDADLVSKIRLLLADPARRDAIAQAGQARVAREHTYEMRLAAVLACLAENASGPGAAAVDWPAFERAADRYRSNVALRLLRGLMLIPCKLLWGPVRGPRAARRLLFEVSWRLAGRRTYTAAGLPGRLFYRES